MSNLAGYGCFHNPYEDCQPDEEEEEEKDTRTKKEQQEDDFDPYAHQERKEEMEKWRI